jgi:nicotinate-nucleotide adenylyltransferase
MTSGRIGILGGRFDPIHRGHLEAATAARHSLTLKRVLLLPSGPSPHRASPPHASDADRLAMVRLAAATAPWLEVCDLEMATTAPSFTSVTLQHLREQGVRRTQLFFIVGADAFADIAQWHDYPAVLDRAHFVVVSRPGDPVDALKTRLAELAGRMRSAGPDDPSQPLDRSVTAIHLLDATTPEISSTDIRARIARGEPLDGQVPPAVGTYINERHLYRPADGE